MAPQTEVLIVTALPCEARPLIDHWRMQRNTHSRAFPVYHSPHKDGKGGRHNEKTSLIVSGIGKVNAAAACAHLHNLCAPQTAIWINTGIAGHTTLALGDTLIAHAIEDASSGQKWYPPIVFKPACRSEAILSVDTVSAHYPKNTALDREASAFFAIANRYTTAELVHSIKVISDNEHHSHEHITASQTSQWMTNTTDLIQHTADQLRELARHLPVDAVTLPECLQHLHFTVTQRRQCLDLLRRWRTLTADTVLPTAFLQAPGNTREAIDTLRQHVEALTPSYLYRTGSA